MWAYRGEGGVRSSWPLLWRLDPLGVMQEEGAGLGVLALLDKGTVEGSVEGAVDGLVNLLALILPSGFFRSASCFFRL